MVDILRGGHLHFPTERLLQQMTQSCSALYRGENGAEVSRVTQVKGKSNCLCSHQMCQILKSRAR